MADKKFYQAVDARSPIAGVLFIITEHTGGTHLGVYATETEEEQDKIDALVKVPGSSIFEIDGATYEEELKKKPPESQLQNQWMRQPVAPESHLKGTSAAVVVEGKDSTAQEKPVEINKVVETAEDALKTGPVNPSAPEPTAAPEKKRGKKE